MVHRRYGDVFTVRILPKGRPLVLFTRPEHAKEIFAGDPEVFHAGKGNAILGPIMGEHSLLLQDCGEHKRARKLLMPAFNGHALRGYEALVTDVARAEVGRWRDGEEFRSLDRMNALTLEVILRVVFGVTDEDRLAALRPRVNEDRRRQPGRAARLGLPAAAEVRRRGSATVENAYALDRLMYAEIRERRQAPDLAERTDVLSQLIRVDDGGDRLTDEELRDQLVTLLLAGHETTASALAWALHEVGRDPEQRRRARARPPRDGRRRVAGGGAQGVDAAPPGDPDGGPHPDAAGHDRRPRPARGRHGRAVDPDRARPRATTTPTPACSGPERFVGQNPPTNTWIPFGGGVRRCIGAGFSLMEGVAVLREVFAAYDVETVGRDVPKVRNITSVPRHGSRIRVTVR